MVANGPLIGPMMFAGSEFEFRVQTIGFYGNAYFVSIVK